MNEDDMDPTDETVDAVDLDEIGHPKGTLAIVIVYGLLFAAGWVALYVFEFMPRGAPHP